MGGLVLILLVSAYSRAPWWGMGDLHRMPELMCYKWGDHISKLAIGDNCLTQIMGPWVIRGQCKGVLAVLLAGTEAEVVRRGSGALHRVGGGLYVSWYVG